MEEVECIKQIAILLNNELRNNHASRVRVLNYCLSAEYDPSQKEAEIKEGF